MDFNDLVDGVESLGNLRSRVRMMKVWEVVRFNASIWDSITRNFFVIMVLV